MIRKSRIFNIGDLRSGQYRDLSRSCQWGNVQMLHIPRILNQNHINFLPRSCRTSRVLMDMVQLLSHDLVKVTWGVIRGRIPLFTNKLLIRMKIETCTWYQCVCLVKTHRIDSTHMQHDLVESPFDLDLRPNVWPWLFKLTCICFDTSRREKHDCVKINALRLLLKMRVFARKRFPRKRPFWHLMTPGAKTIDF